MAIVANNMTAAEITADLTTLQTRMQFNTPEIYINGAIAFLNAFIPVNSAQFTFNTISSTLLVATQNSTGIVWTINGSGFDINSIPFLTGTRTSETFQFPASNVTLASTPHLETGNFTFTITDTDLAGANVQVVVNSFVASQSTVSDAGIVGVVQGAFSADGNGTTTAFSLTNGAKALSLSGFSLVNNTVGPVGIVGPLFIPAALAGNDTITITGTAGIDLFGFAGNDTMIGGVGSDTLFGGEGNDSISGGAGNDLLFGNAGNDTLIGGDGNDTLRSGLGSDVLDGGNGDDAYFIDVSTDVILADSSGIDTVNLYYTTGTYTLAADLEHINLLGTAAINGTGNALDNIITGNAGNNVLTGGLGNDILNGGLGQDVFVFDTALNELTNKDIIQGFNVVDDQIKLDAALFSAIGVALDTNEFISGAGITTAATANQHIIFNSTTGALYYDADGLGGQAATEFATLIGSVGTLTTNDFFI